MKKLLYFIIFIVVLVSCKHEKERRNDKLYVVTTTGMLYDAVLNIAGDKVDAEAIMGPGVDPHLYKATQGDLTKFNQADVIFYNGILLEGKLSEVLKKLGKQKIAIAVAETIPDSLLMTAVGYQDAYDPHVWFDINRWKYAVKEISRSLKQIDTINADLYRENTQAYLRQLDSLVMFVRSRISEIPPEQRILITAHDAFGYFGDAYGIRVEGLQGISTVADFGLKDIVGIIDLIIENNVKAIFVETSVSEKSIQAVLTGCKEQGQQVVIGGYLYSDAMGEFGTKEGTYIGMFKKNINTIVDALK